MVKIYAFQAYSIVSDRVEISPRMATRDVIARIDGAEVIAGTQREIDASRLDGNGTIRLEAVLE